MICKSCKINKRSKCYYKYSSGNLFKKCILCIKKYRKQYYINHPNKYKRRLKVCSKNNKLRYKKDSKFRKHHSVYAKQKHIKDPRIKMLISAKKRAVQQGLKFNLSLNDLFVPKKCPILDIVLKVNSKISDNSPSLDKVDNNKGYIKGNVKVISYLANSMKRSATKKQLLLFAKNIQHYLES